MEADIDPGEGFSGYPVGGRVWAFAFKSPGEEGGVVRGIGGLDIVRREVDIGRCDVDTC